ncbi:MAG TPA: response regulator, partial [Polyangiaceae bacterium]|nr:response regulator [Polyangiaceae bacterium]
TSRAPRELIDGALRLVDEMSALLAKLTAPSEARPDATSKGHPGAPASVPPDEPLRMVSSDLVEVDSVLDGISEASAQLTSLRTCLTRTERARRLAQLLDEQLGALRLKRTLNGSSARMRSLSAELRAVLEVVERELGFALDQVNRELSQVREAAESLRMLPASVLFHPLERTVRDVASASKRRVAFVAVGGELRMDSHMLNVVQNALVQVIRNAIAHGIEPEAERVAAGKPPEGRITLEVKRQGNQLAFICRDDGRGIDLIAVRKAAQQKALLGDRTAALGDKELLDWLMQAGISTAGAVTEISGRGVGLDVVRQAARELGGSVQIDTTRGKGTTFEILLPVSLAAMRALMVQVNERVVAVPLDAVNCTVRVVPEEIARAASGTTLLFQGEVIPFLSLAQALREPEPSSAVGARSAIVLERGSRRAALAVDRLLGMENIVMRPLPPFAPADRVIAGAILDAAGRAQVVVDPDALLVSALQLQHDVRPARERLPLLVIDDSLTTRMLEQSILEAAGYEVDLATSGEEGLDKARKRKYSLFLVDVEMPGMDGFTFIEKTRSDPVLASIPAILLTSRGSAEDRARGIAAGARAHMLKSEFDQGVLLERIQALVESP